MTIGKMAKFEKGNAGKPKWSSKQVYLFDEGSNTVFI